MYMYIHVPSAHKCDLVEYRQWPTAVQFRYTNFKCCTPQEYGITLGEKVDIGKKLCTPLFRKIQADFHHTIVNEQADVLHRLDARLSKGVVSPNRHVRSRLYFTSESHIHSLVNMLRHGGLEKVSVSITASVHPPHLRIPVSVPHPLTVSVHPPHHRICPPTPSLYLSTHPTVSVTHPLTVSV